MDNNIKPKVAWLTTNRTCNNKCKWCYTGKFKCKNLSMNLNRLKLTVDELYKNGINKIILIGGEPTINDNIIEIISYIKCRNIKVSIASNGRKFSDLEFAHECKKVGLDFVNVSIKGIDDDEYIKNTGNIGFDEMLRGYKNLKDVGIDTTLSYVITKNDRNEYINLKNMLILNDIDYIFFMLYKPSVDDNNDYDGPSIEELALACKTVYEVFENSGVRANFEMSIPLCLLEDNLLNNLLNKNMMSTCCHISKGKGIIFDTDFNILPCNHFVDYPMNKEIVVPQEIVQFWNSETCNEFRKTIRTYPAEKCIKCEKWHICGGGCFLRWLKDDPNSIINSERG